MSIFIVEKLLPFCQNFYGKSDNISDDRNIKKNKEWV